MKNMPTIDLADDVPEYARTILERLGRFAVTRGQFASRLRVDGRVVPLLVVAGGLRSYAYATAPLLASHAGDDRLGLVVADRLPAHVRRELEKAGCAYADGTGAVHVEVPGFFLHVEPAVKPNRPVGPPGVGVVAVRLVQTMLADPDCDWTVAALAQAAGSSTGQAHKILVRLESDGFVSVRGQGPKRRRRVTHPGELLDWLATAPSSRRIRERLTAYLYAPDVNGLVTRLSAYAWESQLNYAVTGAAGAAVLGARVATATPLTMVRVDPDVDLPDAAQRLRAEPADNGANLMLVRDVGELGVHGSVRNGPVAVAPPVRIWLDMLGEPRGEDSAALFREAVLGW